MGALVNGTTLCQSSRVPSRMHPAATDWCLTYQGNVQDGLFTADLYLLQRNHAYKPLSITNFVQERMLTVERHSQFVDKLRSIIQDKLREIRKHRHDQASKGRFPNSSTGHFVLVAHIDFNAGEKLSWRLWGRHLIVKAMDDYLYHFKHMGNWTADDVHTSCLKLYYDTSLDHEAIIRHIIGSETGMDVRWQMCLAEIDDGLVVKAR